MKRSINKAKTWPPHPLKKQTNKFTNQLDVEQPPVTGFFFFFFFFHASVRWYLCDIPSNAP
jgi:hypothetical protein